MSIIPLFISIFVVRKDRTHIQILFFYDKFRENSRNPYF